jgi:hypothetical protein
METASAKCWGYADDSPQVALGIPLMVAAGALTDPDSKDVALRPLLAGFVHYPRAT